MAKCNTFELLDILGKKWTLVLIQEIYLSQGQGFNFLLKRMGALTPKMLSKRLNELEIQGLIKKDADIGKLKTTKYSLTDKGIEVKEIIDGIRQWGIKYSKDGINCNRIEKCMECHSYNE